ncbi:MAG: BREX-1 system adenine-specific DNA-methyltransferase PglX [Candidatus Thiodiazotropha lotti]|nr:BREX-1 system adenine-specific DNA-methyltransferase PglX [Candidatus Thiodiazotropha lotti]
METAKLKKFAQAARRSLREQVTAKLALVLGSESTARREHPDAVKKLEEAIRNSSNDQVIERVAYIWFNRFCALRFMDVNRYTRIGVVSPAEGQSQPEILAEAKMGLIDEELADHKTRQHILDLLAGKAPSADPQGEAYRMLLVASCNYWHRAMPFLFERIDDYTELLMPDGLLSANSILDATREAMSPDTGVDVEVIGWLYQFYISEKKDEVFDGLKKNKKITPENIPAATQLFTPHWIVRYLVENSLGRLWLLNRPGSKLAERMDYYIKPEQAETDFPKITRPEEIKICDPACGSGHMLTYAFDLLYAIYEEEGYEPAEIPEKILTNNLYGIEIDERAGELAAFALTMKARARQRRFFNRGVRPNICVLENIQFEEDELKEYMDFVGRDLFTAPLQTTLRQFEEADNFGSLIRPEVTDVDGMLKTLESKNVSGQLFISMTHQKVLQALRQADYLSPKYHVVIANPPYMGSGGMNERLKAWGKIQLPDCWGKGRSDTFAMFISRTFSLVIRAGFSAMVTMESWMFLETFRALREQLLDDTTLLALVHMPYLGKGGTSMGINFGTSAFVIRNAPDPKFEGHYSCVRYFETDNEGVPYYFPVDNERLSRATAEDFKKLPSMPISYWLSETATDCFDKFPSFSKKAVACQGLATTDNNRFVRDWYEVSFAKCGFEMPDSKEAAASGKKWFPMDKGGDYRRWFGNNFALVNWQHDGKEIRENIVRKYPYLKGNPDFVAKNPSRYFQSGVTWGKITSGTFSARFSPKGSIFSDAGMKAFSLERETNPLPILGLLNSKVATFFLSAFSETMNFEQGNIARLPFAEPSARHLNPIINFAKADWDSYETSWDFTSLPLLSPDYRQSTLKANYQNLRTNWLEMTHEMQRLEEDNNRIFIEAYGLNDELTPEVPLNEITLTCNPHYRYVNDKSEDELEALLLADTMRELVSYAVGCMFGRYALDKPGLILANQGETIEDYLKRIPEPSFPADDDNVIPMLDGDWFTDDIAERFRKFLRVAFGDEHYEENLRFVEQALNIKGKRNYGIRDYFLSEFYNDHVKRYKKRPIYWLFSSPKGSFNALIYMHRYRPDTVSVVLNEYLREFRGKLSTRLDHLRGVEASADATKGEKTKALKEIEKLKKTIEELDAWERDVIYPLATEQIAIDLDDGVKANYPRFGAALKKAAGLS